MRVYTNNTRVNVSLEVDGKPVVFKLKPLTFAQKSEFASMPTATSIDQMRVLIKALQFTLVSASGIQDEDGNPWQLSHDAEGLVASESIDALIGVPEMAPVSLVAIGLLKSIPSEGELCDAGGNVIPGVTVALGK